MTIYKRELYDCAEMHQPRIPPPRPLSGPDAAVDRTVGEILERWQLPDGHFRSRRLILGWDNVPCTGGGQSAMSRALCLRLGGEQDASNSN